jgi:hypothetical protein
MSDSSREKARREALKIVDQFLGIQPSVAGLLEIAASTLGAARVGRCLERVRESRLTRRSYALASLAALVVATRKLGDSWWRRPRHPSDKPGYQQQPPPDELLATWRPTDQPQSPTALEKIAQWAASDVADALWGAPVDNVDLNSLEAADRIAVPPGARVGDRLVVAFDPGSRVDAVVTRRSDGSLGGELDLDSTRHSPPAEVEWGWSIACGIGPHRLPDEEAGGVRNPYAAPIDSVAAATLSAWALARGAGADEIGAPWKTTGDPIRAIEALYLPGRDGSWFLWWCAAEALADRDAQKLAEAMRRVGPP